MIITQNTNLARYKLLFDKSRNKMYIVDIQYAYSIFHLPKDVEKINHKVYPIDEDISHSFEIEGANKRMSSLITVLLTQPFVAVLYKMGTIAFRSFSSEYYVLIKVLLLILTLILISSAYFLFSKSQERKLKERLLPNTKSLSLKVIKPNDIKVKRIHYFRERIVSTLVLVVIPTLIYFSQNDGSENAILVIISILFFLNCIMATSSPISTVFYTDYDFVLED